MGNEPRIVFKAKHNKPREELFLPGLTFHHADHWMKILGMEKFSAWLMIYTWCDRELYPQDDVSHHKDIKEIARAFGCGVDKAQNIIKDLYEFGLIDIIQEKTKYGSMKNVYYWYEIPIYADSMFCELKKFRSWSDRNWHGQELAKLRKIKEEKAAIKSRTENPYGSEIDQKNCGLQNELYEKSVRQPYGKSVHNNVINNNVVVGEEKTNSTSESNNWFSSKHDDAINEIQKLTKDKCKADLPVKFLTGLIKKYPLERIKEKIELIGSGTGEIINMPGLLLAALRDNYIKIPGQAENVGMGENSAKKTNRAGKLKPPTPKLDSGELNMRKELIKRLYLS